MYGGSDQLRFGAREKKGKQRGGGIGLSPARPRGGGSQALHGLQVNEKQRTPPLDTPFASVKTRVGVMVGEWVDDGGATGAV